MHTFLVSGDEGDILCQLIFDIVRKNVILEACLTTLLIMAASLPRHLRKHGSYSLDRFHEFILTNRCPDRVRALGSIVE